MDKRTSKMERRRNRKAKADRKTPHTPSLRVKNFGFLFKGDPNSEFLLNLNNIHSITQTVMTQNGDKVRFLTSPYWIPETGEKANIFAVDLLPIFGVKTEEPPEEYLSRLLHTPPFAGHFSIAHYRNERTGDYDMAGIFLSEKGVKLMFSHISADKVKEVCRFSREIG